MKKLFVLLLAAMITIGIMACAGPAQIPGPSPTLPAAAISPLPASSPAVPTNVITPLPTIPEPTPAYDAAIESSAIQVWGGEQLLATGIAVGGGSQVLTVLNWEVSSPANLEVMLPGGKRYPAVVQGLDARTSVTLLKVDGAVFPVIKTGNSDSAKAGQKAFIYDWHYTGTAGANALIFRKTPALIGDATANQPLWLSFTMTDEMRQGPLPVFDLAHGAIVTDDAGSVIGLDIGDPDQFFFAIPPGASRPGYIYSAVKINSALELLSPDAAKQPWANGPLEFIIANTRATASYGGGSIQNYAAVTTGLYAVLNQIGAPLATSDLQKYQVNASEFSEGLTVTVVYPTPVTLSNQKGDQLAQAKWIAVQWGLRGGLPDRLYYGNKGGTVLGGFNILSDTYELESLIDALGYHAP